MMMTTRQFFTELVSRTRDQHTIRLAMSKDDARKLRYRFYAWRRERRLLQEDGAGDIQAIISDEGIVFQQRINDLQDLMELMT